MMGISLVDFSINIDSNTRTKTIININNVIHTILEALETLTDTCCVIPATIEENISIDTQLATPYSVISSQSRTNKIAQNVIANADNNNVTMSVLITCHPSKKFMKNTIHIPCKNANGTVRYLLYCCIFCCHTSHCSVNSSR